MAQAGEGANFWATLGDTFAGVSEGVVSIIGGVGAQIGASATMTTAQAEYLSTQAANYRYELEAEERKAEAQRKQLYFVFALVFLAPLLAMLIFAIVKSRKK